MFGQSIIKNIHAVGKLFSTGGLEYYKFATVSAAILVIGLVPSLIILVIILIADEIQTWIYVAQIIQFLLAAILYYFANGSVIYAEEMFKSK